MTFHESVLNRNTSDVIVDPMSRTAETDPRRAIGADAEQSVADHLSAQGWRILSRNVRWREGELDIVALHDGALVFIEVKALVARDGAAPFSPFESIGHRKQRKVRMLARRWMSDELPRMRADGDLGFSSVRFDAVAVKVESGGGVLSIDHVADAF